MWEVADSLKVDLRKDSFKIGEGVGDDVHSQLGDDPRLPVPLYHQT